MSRLALWCFQHRRRVVAGWLLALVVVFAASSAVGSSFDSDTTLPGTDSQAAISLLTQNFPAAAGEGDQVVVQATHGSTVNSPAVRTQVKRMLTELATVPGVVAVDSPYSAAGRGQTSADATIAFATVTWDSQLPATADVTRLISVADSADAANVRVSLAGEAISDSQSPGTGLSVAVAVVAALVILMIVFGGALLSSVLPLAAAALGLMISLSVTGLLTHLLSIPSLANELSVLIGLGVGVDYGLFIISRHRSGVKAGLSYQEAAVQAVNTSGRTVLFAGITVCIALLGQLALGVGFLNGMSIATAIAVALTMATSITFLPAMFGFLGPKVLSRRERRIPSRRSNVSEGGRFWLRWASSVQNRAWLVAAGSTVVVILVAMPIFGLRLGSSDSGTDPSSSTTYQAYTTLAKGFGAGSNGPLELAGQLGSPADKAAFDRLLTTAAHTPGVASVSPAVLSPNGKVALATLYPSTSPQDAQTVDLVNHLRDQQIPAAERGSSLVVHVGGGTASNIDFAHVLTDKLPLFIAVVVILAFLLLMAVFRSLLIPVVASAMNLLSVGAALGALNAVFNWGFGKSLLGLSGTGPIDAFLPVLMFSVLFGLSMDYEVYLVSRIHEEWRGLQRGSAEKLASLVGPAGRRNHRAVLTGQAKSGPVIAAAAGIMILVFGSFLLTGQRQLEEFGFGLAFSVLVDALVIRSLLVPALMHLIGPANWAFPSWLERVVPRLSVEADESVPTAAADEPAYAATLS